MKLIDPKDIKTMNNVLYSMAIGCLMHDITHTKFDIILFVVC